MIELMVMLAVLAVVMSVGVPQLNIFFKGSRMVSNTNDLIGGFHLARSSAIKRSNRVTICKSSNAGSGSPTCSTTANWEDGWFVFEEGPDDGVAANAIGLYNSNDGDVLRVNIGAEGTDTTIRPRSTDTGIANFVSFSSRGLPTQSNGVSVSGVFMVCDDRGLKNASGNVVANGVVLQVSGRVSASKTESKIGTSCP